MKKLKQEANKLWEWVVGLVVQLKWVLCVKNAVNLSVLIKVHSAQLMMKLYQNWLVSTVKFKLTSVLYLGVEVNFVLYTFIC
jgi:hypothetical protein